MSTTQSSDQIYTAAADAITDGQLEVYEAIKAASPELDWSGHDRRAALARGATLADLGPDPADARYTQPDPSGPKMLATRPVLHRREVSRCKACKAPIWYYGDEHSVHPFDVQEGRGSLRSHFITCPEAKKFRKKKQRSQASAA